MTVIVPSPKEMRITDKFSSKRHFLGPLPSDGRVFSFKNGRLAVEKWRLEVGGWKLALGGWILDVISLVAS